MNRACGSSSTGAVEKEEGSVSCGMELPGFRFHPTDEELVSFYLRKRVLHQHGEKDHILVALQHLIPDLDIYKYDPWDLPRLARLGEGSSGCYFFSPRDRKYRNSTRPNRVTSSGFWKATGTDRHVYSGGSTSVCVGLKKSLVFYLGRSSTGTKTNWMMHEFRIPSRPEDTCWALCKIFKRKSNSSQCVSEMQAFAAEEVPCAAEATLDKLEAVDSFGGEDCSEEDSKSENTICVLPTPTSDGPITSFADIHTPSSDTSQDEVATDCLVRSSEMTECDLPSSVKTEPLTVRVSKGSDFWSDDLWSLFPSPATMKPFDNSRFTGQPCFLGDPNLPFTDHSDQESLQASMPECLWHLLSSPQWNPALPLPLWDQPAYFHDLSSFNTLS